MGKEAAHDLAPHRRNDDDTRRNSVDSCSAEMLHPRVTTLPPGNPAAGNACVRQTKAREIKTIPAFSQRLTFPCPAKSKSMPWESGAHHLH